MNVLIEVNSFQLGKYSKTLRIFNEIFLRNISIGKKSFYLGQYLGFMKFNLQVRLIDV